VGIASLMWVGGHLVYAKTHQFYAMSTFKSHSDMTSGVSEIRLSSDELQVTPRRIAHGIFVNGLRNGFSREFQNLRVGDEIQVSTREGIFGYFVTTIEIADPSESRVRTFPGRSELTITTTPPIPFVGAAPQQFIVHARPENELTN
jgi:Sortase domain